MENTEKKEQDVQKEQKFTGILETQQALNKGSVVEKRTFTMNSGEDNTQIINDTLDNLFNSIPKEARFAGSSQSVSLPANITDEFDVIVADSFDVTYKLGENITVADREKQELRPTPIKSMNASIKIPAMARYNGKEYTCNINVTRENLPQVKSLLANKTAKATTSFWGNDEATALRKQNGELVARVVLVGSTENQQPKIATTEASLTAEQQ